MRIYIYNNQRDLKLSARLLKSITHEVIALENQKCHEVSLHFVDQETICQLHLEFFDDPSPTDTISFPMDGPEETDYRVLGDVFVCPYTAIIYSEKHNREPLQETILYLVHGLLHLLGYDDVDPISRKAMRLSEKKHLRHLKSKGLL